MVRSGWQAPALAASLAVAAVARGEDVLPAITRDQVMANAAAYTYETWRVGAANLSASCDPGWSTDYTEGDYVGLPYNWGGFDDLASFQRKLDQGFGAGAHAEHGVLSCTTGLDCSGFISRVWQLPTKYSTSVLSEVTSALHDIDDVRPGDAWVKPGVHVVLHAYFRDDGTPAWYESSGGADKVRFMTSGSWAQLDGYQPVRYKGIQETVDLSHAGTLVDPIPIPSFPFTDSRNTVLAASDEMDEYPCKVGTSEEGPELVYVTDLPSAGKLTATVTHIGGVDLDLHLLSGPGPETCVARADRTLKHEVKTPGRYYLVVDGYSKARDEFSGPYKLDVGFAAPATSTGTSAGCWGCGAGGGTTPGGLAVLLLLAALHGSGRPRTRRCPWRPEAV